MIISEKSWGLLLKNLKSNFNKEPDINAILFLIGVQELGKGFGEFSKEQKQDLIHIATCKILSFSGYYKIVGLDGDGWPVWENVKVLPPLSLVDQEVFMRHHIVEYFSDIYNLK